jgi:metal-responsive CopG/Arc/MetJ family transcriptional regulator
MARTTKIISISTHPNDLRVFDEAAARAKLSRSEFFNQAAARAVADSTASRETRMSGNSNGSNSTRSVHESAQVFKRRQAQDQERARGMVERSGNPVTSPLASGRPGWRSK